MKVKLKDKRIWDFEYNKKYDMLVYITKKNVYALFFTIGEDTYNKGELDIWIGRLIKVKSKTFFWATAEKEIKAVEIQMFRGKFIFGVE